MTNLVEVFSSTQGEGMFLGVRQVFLRFAGCNLSCPYCDTVSEPAPAFRVEPSPGTGKFDYYPNPAQPEEVSGLIRKFNLRKCHSISLTGGEPLLHVEFIERLVTLLKDQGLRFYLETNGTLPAQLARLLAVIDIIGMDFKLPSSAKCREMWKVHRDFLQIGSAKEIFVKIVVTGETSEAEIIKTCRIISGVNAKIPLIIQPVTPHQKFKGENPPAAVIMRWQELALDYLQDVRVVPQTHKFLGYL